MLRRFKGGAAVACDVPGCPHTFRSFSRAALVRGQAELDKWTHRQPTKLERDAVRAGTTLVIDRCPTHSVVVAAPVADLTVSIAAAAEPEKLVSRDSSSLTTETISLVSGQPASGVVGDASVETVGGDRLSSTGIDKCGCGPSGFCPMHDQMYGIVPGNDPVARSPATDKPTGVTPRKRRVPRPALAVVVEPPPRKGRPRMGMPGTLVLVAEILRAAGAVLSVREIVERAGDRLPSKSKTPATVVSRDLALAIKSGGDASIFVRTAPGRFTLRELALASAEVAA